MVRITDRSRNNMAIITLHTGIDKGPRLFHMRDMRTKGIRVPHHHRRINLAPDCITVAGGTCQWTFGAPGRTVGAMAKGARTRTKHRGIHLREAGALAVTASGLPMDGRSHLNITVPVIKLCRTGFHMTISAVARIMETYAVRSYYRPVRGVARSTINRR
jgi:hypothetical protein